MRRARYQYGSVRPAPRKNGPDVWIFRYYETVNGVKVRRAVEIGTVEDLPKRRDALRAAEAYRVVANPERPAARGITFGALLDRYTAEDMPKRFSTAESYKSYIRTHIRPKWGEHQISDVRPFAVEQWLNKLPLEPKSRGHIKTIMSSAFDSAMRWEFIPIDKNPMSLVRVPDVTKRRTKARVLSTDEVQRLIAEIKVEPYRTMAWVAICLGLIPSELAALKWGDCNFDRLEIRIQRGVVSGRVDKTKNAYREAPLPLDPLLAEILIQWRACTPWAQDKDWIFASPYQTTTRQAGEKPLQPWHAAERYIQPAAKRAGLGEHIGWKTFRRTYSSLLRRLGVDMKVQQDLLRHADIRTTMNLYTDSFSEDMKTAQGMIAKEVFTARVQ